MPHHSVWNESTAKKYVGNTLESCLGYSLDEDLRNNAASGGMVSTILINELQENHIEGALVCRTVIKNSEVVTENVIAVTKKDILQGQGSKYISTRFTADALELV